VSVPVFLHQKEQAWKASAISDVTKSSGQLQLSSYLDSGNVGDTKLSNETMSNGIGDLKSTAESANGRLTIGSQKVSVSAGNTILVEIGSNGYRISGANTNLNGWKYVYESISKTGSWKGGDIVKPDIIDPTKPDTWPTESDCEVTMSGTTLSIGKALTRCTITSQALDTSLSNKGYDRSAIANIMLNGVLTIKNGPTVSKNGSNPLFSNMPALTTVATAKNSSVTTSGSTSFVGLFAGSNALKTVDFTSWDTSKVTDMSKMFYGDSAFNSPLSFDTSSVSKMDYMFAGASSFDSSLGSGFHTSKVTSMDSMFAQAASFNQPLGDGFDTSSVTSMSNMFSGATVFDQPLGAAFTTGKTTNMSGMFANTDAFNQALPTGFTTSNVTDMSSMFLNTKKFNQNLSGFDMSHVTTVKGMFRGSRAFNQDISSWDVHRVKDFSYMFDESSAFNQKVSGWDLSSAKTWTDFNASSNLSNANIPWGFRM
jgi:surface protein